MSDLTVQSTLDAILFIFVTASIPVYIVVVITLIKYRNDLNSSFFTFFISAGIADLVATFHKYLTRHIPMLIWGSSLVGNVWLATFHRMGFWSLYFSQIIGVFWLSANRMTALAFPFRHKTMWTPVRIKLAIALQWVLPLGFSIPMFHPCCQSYFGENMNPIFNSTKTHEVYFLIDLILEPGFFMPSFILFYSVAFWKARKHAKKEQTVMSKTSAKQSATKSKAERNLATTGAVLSGIYVMMCIVIILVILGVDATLLYYSFYPLSDLFTMSNPYLLLIFSTKFRPYFKAVLMCRKPEGIKSSGRWASSRKGTK